MTGIIIDSKCPRCKGTLTTDGGEPVCLNCGYRPISRTDTAENTDKDQDQVIEPRPKDPVKMVKWNAKYRSLIRADYEALGKKATLKKWQITACSLGQLVKNRKTPPSQQQPPDPEPNNNRDGPDLPAFRNEWQPEVQIKWFDCYLAVINSGGGVRT